MTGPIVRTIAKRTLSPRIAYFVSVIHNPHSLKSINYLDTLLNLQFASGTY